MTVLRCGMFLLIALATSTAGAEPICRDALFNAYLQAGRDVAKEKNREDVLAKLKVAIDKHPNSRFANLVKRFARDLATSIDQVEKRAKAGRNIEDSPAEFLSESKMPLYLLAIPQNWIQGLPSFMERSPRDPAVLLLKQGRKSIDDLLPRLSDDSPTLAPEFEGDDELLQVPRVSDLSLHLIEKLSACKFQFDASSAQLFHQLWETKREETAKHIAQWWQQNRDKSIAEGIRAQLPQGDFYGKLTMAENLIRVAGDENPQDREHGLEVLRRLSRSLDLNVARAEQALERYGGPSLLESYCAELKKSMTIQDRWYPYSIEPIFYLADHGKRKEWEFLRDIVVKDLKIETELLQRGRNAYVLRSLLGSKKCTTVPYAIPLLGLALSRTQHFVNRYINEKVGSQSFSTADVATEYLQKLTGQDFGYRVEGTDKEREAAIERAQKWWADEGKAKYTFDYIEQNLVKPAAAKKAVP